MKLLFLIVASLGLLGCAARSDLLHESIERRTEDREIRGRYLNDENRQENYGRAVDKRLKLLEAHVEMLELDLRDAHKNTQVHRVAAAPKRDLKKAGRRAAELTDAEFRDLLDDNERELNKRLRADMDDFLRIEAPKSWEPTQLGRTR